MNKNTLLKEYEEKYVSHLKSMAERLNIHLASNLEEVDRIDRVSARAKTPKRFIDKAEKIENGQKKYSNPLKQIQDQIGARIVTFYLSDVLRISEIIEKYYRPIESKLLVPESESQFGYIGKHYILFIPEDLFETEAEKDICPQFFELQIKTLFQHAWSEANHDLGYKTDEVLTSLQKRQIAFTAAQAWGADHMFDSLSNELVARK